MTLGNSFENMLTLGEIVLAVWLAKHGYAFSGGVLFGSTISLWLKRRLNESGVK